MLVLKVEMGNVPPNVIIVITVAVLLLPLTTQEEFARTNVDLVSENRGKFVNCVILAEEAGD